MNDTHFQAVIVGSGFGGAVTAYRLAEAGLRVCLLKRGKAYPPGSFPRSPHTMKNNFWDPSEGLQGMFNAWLFRNLGALVSSGLGGGSLIYANVLIRKDEKWFVKEDVHHGGYEYWPVTRADLDPHYHRVEKMLNAQRYPFEHEPYKQTPKTRALKSAAAQLDLNWCLPHLAVTFANAGETPVLGEPIREGHQNMHGRTRYTCRLCGECDFGCNYGSKNTLDYNYLSEAKRLGAEIRTRCEVRTFEPRDGVGYTIRYVKHDPEREGKKTDTSQLPQETITADQLILAAGTLGTTFLLLKNRGNFPRISEKVGTRFCGNGDLLTFALRSRHLLDPNFGPVITSAIRVADALDGGQGRGFYIEDAGYPAFISWILQTSEVPRLSSIWRLLRFVKRYLWGLLGRNPDSDLSAEIAELLGTCELTANSLPLLGMGRDIPDGNMRLRSGYLDIDWKVQNSKAYFDRLRETMKAITREWQADFRDNPIWWLNRVVTVHPLGGCPMGRDANEGVVDPYGEVFHYPGFYIADGSVMPGPVGPNPSLTIAALADRFADRIIEKASA